MDKIKTNNMGLTLVELLIYMVLGTLVITYAMSTMKTVSTQYVHGREVTKMQQDGRDAINILARDLTNTGFKYFIEKDTVDGVVNYTTHPTRTGDYSTFLFGSYLSNLIDGSYGTHGDSTGSFFHVNGAPGDELEIFRLRLVRTDLAGSIEGIKYFQSNDTLYRVIRTCNTTTLSGGAIDWQEPDTVAIIDNVVGVQYQFSADGRGWGFTPTLDGTRSQMKYIKAEILISSHRDAAVATGGEEITIGGDQTFIPDGSSLYRVYAQTIPILNNGVLR